MFKALRALSAVIALLGAAVASAQTPQPLQVAPGAYMVQGVSAMGSSANRNFISNAAFVVTPEGVLLVDALAALDGEAEGGAAEGAHVIQEACFDVAFSP